MEGGFGGGVGGMVGVGLLVSGRGWGMVLGSWDLRWRDLRGNWCEFGGGVLSWSGADGDGRWFWGIGDVEGFFHGIKIDVADYGCTEEKNDFEAFRVFHFDAGVVGFVDGDFFEVFEECNGDVRFFISLLGTIRIPRFAGEITDQVFGQLSLLLPFEVDLGGGV